MSESSRANSQHDLRTHESCHSLRHLYNQQSTSSDGDTSTFVPPPTRLFPASTLLNTSPRSFNSYEYNCPHSDDPYGQETFSDARVWKVYMSESNSLNQDRVGRWRDTVDVLLVFTGLFSAIVTTFVVQTSQSLEPNYNRATAYLVYELVNIHRAIANGTSLSFIPTLPHPDAATPSASLAGIWVNGLWYASLSLSLSTALIAVLTKQWLYHYMSSVSGNPRDQCRLRQFRSDGLERWQVPMIIELLPVTLHLALALFFAGLVLQLTTVHASLAYVVASITGTAFTLYLISLFLPLWFPDSPYKSPLSRYVYFWIFYVRSLPLNLWNSVRNLRERVVTLYTPNVRHILRQQRATDFRGLTIPSMLTEETLAVAQDSAQLDVDAIVTLYNSTSDSNIRSVAMQAFSGLGPPFPNMSKAKSIIITGVWPLLQACEKSDYEPFPGKEKEYDRLLRALVLGYDTTFPLHGSSSLERLSALRPDASDPRSNLLQLVPLLSGVSRAQFAASSSDFGKAPRLHHAEVFSSALVEFFPSHSRADVHLHPSVWHSLLRSYSGSCRTNVRDIRIVAELLLCLGRSYFFSDLDGIELLSIGHNARDLASVTLSAAIENSAAVRELAACCLFLRFRIQEQDDIRKRHALLRAIKDWALGIWQEGDSSKYQVSEIPLLLLSVMRCVRHMSDCISLYQHPRRTVELYTVFTDVYDFLKSPIAFDDRLMCWDTLHHATAALLSSSPSIPISFAPLLAHCKRTDLKTALPSLLSEEGGISFFLCFVANVRYMLEQHLDSDLVAICKAIQQTNTLSTLAQLPPYGTLRSRTSPAYTLIPRLIEATKDWCSPSSGWFEWVDYILLPHNIFAVGKILILHGAADCAGQLKILVVLSNMDHGDRFWMERFDSWAALGEDEAYLGMIGTDWAVEFPSVAMEEVLTNARSHCLQYLETCA